MNKYSIHFKLKYIELFKIVGIYRSVENTGIDKKNITICCLNKEKLQNIVNKKSAYRLPGASCKIKNFIKKKK